jgi:putative transposase
VELKAPRVDDRRRDEQGQRQRFTSRILPRYMRRSPKVAEVLPILYLRGLSTGDFRPALEALLGDDAAGLSPTNLARLTACWEQAYADFRQRDLPGHEYVYVWVDGVHFNIRLEEDRLCTLVMIGARPDGEKELSRSRTATGRAPRAGRRCCARLKRRGMVAPALAVGDGALGFWAALREVWPERASRPAGATSWSTCSTSCRAHGITASISARNRSRRVTLPFAWHAIEANVR